MSVYVCFLGQKTINEYMYPNTANNNQDMSNTSGSTSHHHGHTDAEPHGTVIVYDIVAKKPIAHFQAHQQPLSVIAFDPSGTLVCTHAYAHPRTHRRNTKTHPPACTTSIYLNYVCSW